MASTVTAGLANFGGHLDVERVLLFSLAAVFAAVAVPPATVEKKHLRLSN
jgi:hypothetical protein